MVRLRPYKSNDAIYLLSWIKDEKYFAMWCANKFQYPLTEEQLKVYQENYEKDDFAWIMTAVNESGTPVGHYMMRNVDYTKGSLRIGFVMIDSEIRNKGYGKEMMNLAVKYAFNILNVSRVTLGVYDNNPVAHSCYKSVGFIDEKYLENFFHYKDEQWGIYEMAIENKYC